MLQTGHSKIPVYQEELDHIEGIAHSMDILRLISNPADEGPRDLKNCLRPVLYVPESKTLEDREVNSIIDHIIKKVTSKFNAELRA